MRSRGIRSLGRVQGERIGDGSVVINVELLESERFEEDSLLLQLGSESLRFFPSWLP